MEIKIDESDARTLKIIQNNIEELYEKLGILEYQFRKRKEDVIKGVDAALEGRYDFMHTLAEKYELDNGKRWDFNVEKGCFEAPDYPAD